MNLQLQGEIEPALSNARVDIEVKHSDRVVTYRGVMLLDDRSMPIENWMDARDYVAWWQVREDRPRLQIAEFWGPTGSRTGYAEITDEVTFLGKAGA